MTLPTVIRDALEKGHLIEASRACFDYLSQAPCDIHVLSALGQLTTQTKQWDKLLAYLKKALNIEPNNAILHALMGNTMKGQQRWPQATQAYLQALTLDPNLSHAHHNLGVIASITSRYTDAKLHFKQALSLQDLEHTQYELGLVHHHLGELTSAMQCFQRIIQRNDKHRHARHQLAQLYHKQHDYPQAIAHYLACMDEHSSALLHHQLGCAYLANQQNEQAVNAFYHALSIDPQHVETHHNLATYFTQQRALDDALKHWLKTSLLQPDPNTLSQLGRTYYMLGRYQEACQSLHKGLTYDPNHHELTTQLAATYLAMKDQEQAIVYYEKAQAQNPQSSTIPFLLAALKQDHHTFDHPPDSYVQELFDHYADHFEEHLTTQLHYKAHNHVINCLQDHLLDVTDTTIDLGCGTGLAGPMLKPLTRHLTGVDLSSNMLKEAEKKACYDELVCDNIVRYLKTQTTTLLVAIDTLPYMGDIRSLLYQTFKALAPGGHFIFTTETQQSAPFKLQAHARYAHHPDWLQKVARSLGFLVHEHRAIQTRKQESQWVQGYLTLLQRPILAVQPLDQKYADIVLEADIDA